MGRKRSNRRCLGCGRNTKSVTQWCADHRPADAIPHIHRVDGGISFAGLTLTDAQARRLADTIHDHLEGDDSDHTV